MAGFSRTLGRVENYLALKERVDSGDKTVAADLLIAQLDLGNIEFEEASRRYAEMKDLPAVQSSRIEAQLLQLEMPSLLARARTEFQAGRWAEASAAVGALLREWLEMPRLLARAQAEYQAGRWAEASAALKSVIERDPENHLMWFRLGLSLHRQDKFEEALPAHKKAAELPGQYRATATYNVACAYAMLDNKDQAFAWLRKAADVGWKNTTLMATDTDMDSLRDDPRYAEIIALIDGKKE